MSEPERQQPDNNGSNIQSQPENTNLRRLGVTSHSKHTAPMMPKGSSFDRIVPHINYCWNTVTAGPCFPISKDGDQTLKANYVRLVDHEETKAEFNHHTNAHDENLSQGNGGPQLSPDTGFQLNAPNNRPPSRTVPWSHVLYTTGARNALDFYRKHHAGGTATGDLGFSACAHFYFNGECRRGMQCGFFHIIHLDSGAKPGQLASKPGAVPAKASYLEKNRQGNSSNSNNNHNGSDTHSQQQRPAPVQQQQPTTSEYVNPLPSPMMPMMMQPQPPRQQQQQQQYPTPVMMQPGMMWAPQSQMQFQAPVGFVPMATPIPTPTMAFPGNGGWVPMMQPHPTSMPQPYAAMQPMMMQPQRPTPPMAAPNAAGQHSGSSSANAVRAPTSASQFNTGSMGQPSSSQIHSDERGDSSGEEGGGHARGNKSGDASKKSNPEQSPPAGVRQQQQPQVMMMMVPTPQPWPGAVPGQPFLLPQQQQGMMLMPHSRPHQ